MAEEPLRAGVPGLDHALSCHRDDGVVGGPHDGGELGLGVAGGLEFGVQRDDAAIGVLELSARLVELVSGMAKFAVAVVKRSQCVG